MLLNNFKITLDMGDEIKYHNNYIGKINTDFDRTWGVLSSSMNRVKQLAKAGHNRYLLYLILFSFFVFIVIYIFRKF